MLSLRSFHLLFILFSIIGADLFGAWAIWSYAREGNVVILSLGITAIVGGLGLIWYAVKLVRNLDQAGID